MNHINVQLLVIIPWGPPWVQIRKGAKEVGLIGMLPLVTLLCINKVKCHEMLI